MSGSSRIKKKKKEIILAWQDNNEEPLTHQIVSETVCIIHRLPLKAYSIKTLQEKN